VTECRHTIRWSHAVTGLTVGGNDFGATWFQVAIPRFANGDNSRLLVTEVELENAKEQISKTVDQVCDFKPDEIPITVTRIDLVQHIPVPLQDVIAAHRACRHPKFRKRTSVYIGESLRFEGSKRKGRMYSPELRKRKVAGTFTRVEWELHSPALNKDFGGELTWRGLRLTECYRVYRNLSLDFDVSEVVIPNSIYQFLAFAELNK
jgi:hypothetical protein